MYVSILFACSPHVPTFHPLHAGICSSPLHDPAQGTTGEENKPMINVMPILACIKSNKYT